MLGFNAHIPTPDVIKKIKESGVDWVRLDFNWNWMEFEKGYVNFDVMDEVVQECRRVKLGVLGVVGYTPSWARPSGTDKSSPPQDMTAWTRFTRRLAEHYTDQVVHWTLWNEPNVWKYQQSGVKEFIRSIFMPGRDGIRLGNPKAVIVAPDISVGQPNWIEWVDAFKNIQSYYNIFSVHCYGKVIDYTEYGRWPRYLRWFRRILDWWYPEKQSIRKALRGVSSKIIWLTETGWATNVVSELEQCDSYKEVVAYMMSDDPLYKVVFFYEIRDDPEFPRFGVLEHNLDEKLAYTFLRSIK